MNPSRIWTLGAIVAVVAILGAAFGLGVQPSLAAASAADASAQQVQQTNTATQAEIGRLSRSAAKQSELDQQNAFVGRAVTGSLRWNTFSTQIRDTAAQDGVKIVSLGTGDPTDYVAPVAASPAGGAAAPAPTASATPSPGTTPVAAPVLDPAQTGLFGKTDPLISGANLVVIPVTVSVSGSEESSIAFAQDVQRMTRLFAVNNVTYTKGTDSGDPPTTTISGTIYALRG
ncbi:hypothetical protein GCM10025783_22450 [Amnibacterium soli]|uniref:Uncharacterized protein n=1 Tax=Amnibacterium soli TaxID=1282736 RepID=A0ABP8Z8P8_9MICO